MATTVWPRWRQRRSASSGRNGQSARRRWRLILEVLEDRTLPSTYTVINTNDDTNSGSLRWAITQSDANPGSTIDFSIGSGCANHHTGVTVARDHGVHDHRRHQPAGLRRDAAHPTGRCQRGQRERAIDSG